MTTTVLRGKTGALLRIPTGALRRSPLLVRATDFAAFLIDESGPVYTEGVDTWETDLARYTAALAVLRRQDPVVVAITALIEVEPGLDPDPLLPVGANYPPGVLPPGESVPPVLARRPTLQQIKNVFLPFQEPPNEELNPTHWFMDISGSMTRWTLEPGVDEYIESVLEPGTYVESTSDDERWLQWVAIYLESLAQ